MATAEEAEIDRLHAEIERLRDEAISYLSDYYEQRSMVHKLRAALKQYGTHMHDCKMQNFRDESDCTCGWRNSECSICEQTVIEKDNG